MLELQLLLATFAAWANRRQGSVIAYLVEENRGLIHALHRSFYVTRGSGTLSARSITRRA